MNELLNSCSICPRKCNVNRNNNELGFCQMGNKIKVSRAALHYFEEPPISGSNGSGAIFFSGCNLKCVYCQNYDISELNFGKEISIEEFADICINLQNEGANNINLVTPTHFIPLIKEGLILAKEKGLSIPIVYNTSGYENVESLKLLEGLIDIYLPDFKYFDNNLSLKYSSCPNYVEIAKDAIKEMYRQVGKPKFKNKLMTKGVIVRHLLLPTHLDDSKKVIKYLYDTYKDNIYISIMNQYTRVRETKYKELNEDIKESDYNELVNYAIDLGITKAFIQEGETNKESFIPKFDLTGV